MKSRITTRRNGLVFWGLLIVLTLTASLPALAHPMSLSYVNLRLNRSGLEAEIQVSTADLAHDLPLLSQQMLLSADTLAKHQQEIAVLLASRLTLRVAGETLSSQVEDVAPILEQKEVRLRLRYAWRELPLALQVSCQLFPYDPAHKTFVDIYEGQTLKRQLIFDGGTTPQEYIRGRQQGIGKIVGQFLVQGVYHIFTGPDHILFIVGLLLLGGTLKQLLKIVTAFTVAHSVTLCLATLNILNPPARIIEPTIALSIVFVGVHSMIERRKGLRTKPDESGKPATPPDARLLFAFCFGFIHGFGFANALHEMALPGWALGWSLLSFNLGVECGQACIVLTVAPLLALLHKTSDRLAQRVVAVGSLGVIVAGAFWFVQRVFTG